MSSRPPHEAAARDDLKARTETGVVVVAASSVLARVAGLIAYVVFARVLSPADLGAIAIGLSVTVFGHFIADPGLGAALIRREAPPTRDELKAVTGFQLLATLSIALGAVCTAFLLGGAVAGITAIMVASLPLWSLRTPGIIMLERELQFRRIAAIEVTEVIVFQVWAIAAVLAGFGVWGVATGAAARGVAAPLVTAWLAPVGILPPTLALSRIRGVLSFGVAYQAVGLVHLLRDHGLNLGLGAVAGLSTLGLWAIAYRLLQVPLTLFGALWRVSFPAMARMLEAQRAGARLLETGTGLSAALTGLLLAVLVGTSPILVPAVFGAEWEEAADVLPWICLGMMIGGPISTACAGFLFAAGDARGVLTAAVAHTIALLGISLALIPWLGLTAVGAGWLAAMLIEGFVLGRRATARTGARLIRPIAAATVVAVAVGAGGWVAAGALPSSIIVGCLLGLACATLYAALLGLIAPKLVARVVSVLVQGIKGASRRFAPVTG